MPTLFSGLNLGIKAIRAQQVGLQVTGNNIANANTEGYARQRVVFENARPDSLPFGLVGRGVDVKRIERVVDQYAEMALRDQQGQLADLEVQRSALQQVESALNEMSDSDLSTAISGFFETLQDVVNAPEDLGLRSSFLESAESLSGQFNYVYDRLREARSSMTAEVEAIADKVNVIGQEIAALNKDVATTEFSNPSGQEAVDLRDRRDQRIRELGEYVRVRTFETENGSLNVAIGGEFLVLNDNFYSVTTETDLDGEEQISDVVFSDSHVPLELRTGKLSGIQTARDDVLVQFMDDLNTLARGIIFEVNKVHSEGIGLTGFRSVTGTEQVTSRGDVLNDAGLEFRPQNGSFHIHVRNISSGEVVTVNVQVDLDGVGTDMTLNDLMNEINAELAAAGFTSSDVESRITIDNQLEIESSSNIEFGFGEDTSHVLAALGINTLFTGGGARTMGINSVVADDPSKLAVASSFDPSDVVNGEAMLALRDASVINNNSATFESYYQGIAGAAASQTAEANHLVENSEALVLSLKNERERISGVNVDEEVVKMIFYQKVFQGAARFIRIIDEMLDMLINVT